MVVLVALTADASFGCKRWSEMKVRVEFECEIYSDKFIPWFAVNDEIMHTNLECVENLKVVDVETGEEL